MPAATLGAEWLLQLLAVAVGGEVVRCPFIETLVACAMVKPIVCFVNFYTGVAHFLQRNDVCQVSQPIARPPRRSQATHG
jgi:hypothetical protein